MAIVKCNTKVDAQGREITVHGSTGFPIACYHDRLPADIVPWHWHKEWEAVVVQQGTAVFSVDGHTFQAKPGEGIFINSSALHSVWNIKDASCSIHSIVFHPRLIGGGLESVFWQRYVQPVLSNTGLKFIALNPDIQWHKKALECIEGAWEACAAELPGYELSVRSLLSQLSLLLVSHCPAEHGRPDEKALRSSERIKLMLQYIQENYREPLTAASIAKSAAVSESECLRCFREMLNTTPIQYVRQFRVQRAAELLKTTDLKVAEIGAACGFQEMSYFSKIFRQTYGCTPKEYRQLTFPASPHSGNTP